MASPSGTTGTLRSPRSEMSRFRGFGSVPHSTCPVRSACNKGLRLSHSSSSGCLPTRHSWKASLEVGGVFCYSSPRGIHWAHRNDLPASYLLDQNAGIETLMFFDVGDMDWMSIENIPRFLAYRCSSISRLNRDGTQRLGVGLIANEATGNVLPAGEVRFTYWLLQRPCTQLLTEQQAVARWMQALLPLFEEKLAWPPCASIWSDFAAGIIQGAPAKSTNASRGRRTHWPSRLRDGNLTIVETAG